MQLRAKPLLLFLSAFVVGTVSFLGLFQQAGLFQVRNIPIEVADIVQSRQKVPGPAGIETRLRKSLKPFLGQKVWQVDLGRMRAAIVRDEWVKEVLISRSFPNGVRVQVQPKRPELILVDGKGDLWPITDDGSLLSRLPSDAVPDVPLLRGNLFFTQAERRREVIAFAALIPEQGVLSRQNISEISWSNEDGYSLLLMQPKVEVKLGLDRLDLKVLRVNQVMNYMAAHQLEGRVIDASFSKKVLVRLRKGP